MPKKWNKIRPGHETKAKQWTVKELDIIHRKLRACRPNISFYKIINELWNYYFENRSFSSVRNKIQREARVLGLSISAKEIQQERLKRLQNVLDTEE